VLLLARPTGQNTVIVDNVTALVPGVEGHQVRIDIEATHAVKVTREETHQRCLMEQKALRVIG